MRKKAIGGIGIVLVVILVAAVVTAGLFLFPYEPDNPPVADDAKATQEGIQEVANANNKFAFDLYSELDKNDQGNLFYSPYSISTALAMTYEGAKSDTAEEMKDVFYFPEDNILRPNSAAIYNSINEGAGDYELKTGNALWAEQTYSFLEDYFSRVEKYYGGKVANLDFKNDAEGSRQIINEFIEEQTNNKIKDLIPQGVLDSLTRLVLTNAIYFKGTWEWEFDKSDTKDRDFTTSENEIIQVPTMYMNPDKATFNYLDNDDLQILELPYKGDELSMLILLPDEDLRSLDLTSKNLEKWKSKMKETDLDAIYLPKFEFDTKYMMTSTLSGMGMPTAFDSDLADFSGMDGTDLLYISAIIHQAYVDVNEEGTEAAAATAVVMTLKAAPGQLKIFNADHPFIFIIQQKSTGNILFLGRVNNPID